MSENKSIFGYFIKNRAITWLLIIGIIFLGIFSISTIPREIQPEIEIPFASITTALPGATPSDVERLITEPIEKSIGSLSTIKNLSSSSSQGISVVFIEFTTGTDLGEAVSELKDRVDLVENELPQDATTPTVQKAEANTQSIINFSLVGNAPLDQLTNYIKELQEELEKISGVSETQIVGGAEKRVQIAVDKEKAEQYGLNLIAITNTIKSENITMPIGVTTIDQINYSIRFDNRIPDIIALQNLPLITIGPESTPILLKDIAKVTYELPEDNVVNKLSIEGKDPRRSVTLRLFTVSGGNVIKLADQAKEVVENFEQDRLPSEIDIAITNDMSQFIRTDLGILTNSGIQTTILIIIILFLALGLIEGLIAGLVIPLTLLATVIIMDIIGLTINSLTLFSMVIALGIMVDTAIVIMEGIHENRKNGQDAETAAYNAIETYKWPLIAGTFTTIFAFFPMLLVSGIVGEFLKSLPLTISAALISSLFISLTIAPAVAVKFLSKRKSHKDSILQPYFDKIGGKFRNLTNKILASRLARTIVLLTGLILLILSLLLPITGALKTEMFPKTDINFFIINVETPVGSTLNETLQKLEEVQEPLKNTRGIENYLIVAGTSQSQVSTDIFEVTSGSAENQANITVNLLPEDERDLKSFEIAENLREEYKNFSGAKITVRELSEGPPSDAPITVNITGEDIQTLKNISKKIETFIASVNNTQNIRSSFAKGLTEFQFELNKDILVQHGLNSTQVAAIARNLLQETKISDLNWDNTESELVILYQKEKNRDATIQDFLDFEIMSPKGYSVNLSSLGEIKIVEGVSAILHEEQEKIAKVRSDIVTGSNVVEVNAAVEEVVSKLEIPEGYEISFGGDTESIDESFRDLFRSMIIGIILIGFTLVLIFNSLRQPFIILLTLPMALIGVFPGLLLVGLPLSFSAFLGVVALAGVVVNDAIVLIDRINNNRKNGIEKKEAISEAVNARLQPIIMTTITTIVGILPLTLTNDFWAGLGYALIFGLFAATFLTLFIVPVLYQIIERK